MSFTQYKETYITSKQKTDKIINENWGFYVNIEAPHKVGPILPRPHYIPPLSNPVININDINESEVDNQIIEANYVNPFLKLLLLPIAIILLLY